MKKSNITFELKLFKEIKIYPVFYILLLESVDPKISVQNKLPKLLSENKYKIKEITGYDIFKN